MPISFSPLALTNVNQVALDQFNVRTVALENGGYVVAWVTSNLAFPSTFFQRYDAQGVAAGAMTQVVNPTGRDMFLLDIAVAGDGTFSILTSGQTGFTTADQRVFVTSFFEGTGGPSGPQAVLNPIPLGPLGISNGQLVPNPAVASSLNVLISVTDVTLNNDLLRATVTTAGVVTSAPALVTDNYGTGGITEAIIGPGGQQFAISFNRIIDTVGTAIPTGQSQDIVSLTPESFVTVRSTPSTPELTLDLFSGVGSSVPGYSSGGSVTGTVLLGQLSSGAQAYDAELVNLGAGRLLIVWVVDAGTLNPGAGAQIDGVYAQVYNMNNGAPEGEATLIRGFGVGNNAGILQGITLSAELMADGRVALGLAYPNGLTARDVFNTILDPRETGVTLTSSATLPETLVGTAFDDSFTGISTGDRIFGGGGTDTVTFATSAARSVDLQNPGSFPANNFFLTGIENVTGSSNGDLLRGDGVANVLSGLGGNDTLTGRDGDDSLLGGANDDLANGGSGADLLDGGAGIDTLDGGTGDDLLFGGADADRLLGGDANDALYGGDADDRLQGEAGDDMLSGDAGNDILSGGAGNDEIFGGIGLDTLRAEEGADSVYGGADNDVIFAHAGVALVDGGTGTDTLLVSGAINVNTSGVHVDLTGVFDILGLVAPLTRFAEEISGIENVTGSTGNDFITGDGAVNTLRGGLGNDTIVSGGGADILFGGGGADVFVFTGTTGGADQVRDFAIGTDRIGLVDGAFGDINATNIFTRLTINATGTVGASAVAQLIFDNSGAGFGQLTFDADGNGAGAAVLIATLTPTTGTLVALTGAEFVFI